MILKWIILNKIFGHIASGKENVSTFVPLYATTLHDEE